ncbi:HNH endonuclease signature motif containing protein [Williamsia deligens]|uniref:HNH endonuclease signature motif containing protein n=1 Tax=Williamsia deligens TaxID=321325 RepID=A0ABW3GAT3_9NOCA|nr:HNH endonuclease signature motif containing protein [Williamsia deligens]
MAHALAGLPLLHAAFAQGTLSYSKIRALTRVATPEREEELRNVALSASASASQVETLVRALRHIDRRDIEQRERRIDSQGRWRWNEDGTLSVTMRLAPLDGARFLAGVTRAEYERTRTHDDADVPSPADSAPAEARSGDPTTGDATSDEPASRADLWRGVPTDIAAAVVVMADTVADAITVPEFVPGAEIVVHTSDDTVSDGGAPRPVADPYLDGGPALDDAEVDEMSCGGSRRAVAHKRGRPGVVLRWGRRRRLPTRRLLRLVFERDRGCRHPGCGRTRHLHAHHVRFWSEGGTTDPDNLILLCSTHHRALHRGEYGIAARGHQLFSFHAPDGTLLPDAPTTRAATGWAPNRAIATDGLATIGGGTLDLGYTTEVLHTAWAWRRRQTTETAA